jgi:type VI secretion system secreted protein VgrG
VATALLETAADCSIKIENNEIKHTVSLVELHQFIDNHHELLIRIRQSGKATRADDFDDPATYTSFLGKSIAVTITPRGGVVDPGRALEFIGLVTQVNLDNSIDGVNTVLIVAASPTISIDGARRNAHYFEQSAGDIIGALLRKYPITLGTIEATKGKFKFDTQYRETDYRYISRLANSQGLFAYYNGKEFRVTKANSNDVEELVWRETLGSFRMGLGTAPVDYSSKIYNYEQKKTYSQDTKTLPEESALSNLSRTAPEASRQIYKDSGFSVAPKAVSDAKSLDEILQREKTGAIGRMVKCFGQSIVPKVTVGACVRVKGMDKLDGTYWVKTIKHVFDESGKYHNTFVCSPLDVSFPGKEPAERIDDEIQKRPSIGVGGPDAARASVFAGMHVAVVVDNQDPLKLGRIKVKYPWSDSETTDWVRLIVPYAGNERGWFSLPEVDDEVLIGYEFGNTDHPIALGALYNKDNAPPAAAGGQNNDVKLFITRGGNQILLNDKDGAEELQITTKDGKNQIVMKMSGPEISIKSEGDISIKGMNLTIESQQEITLKAGTNLNIESGANMKSKAGAMLDIEGTMVTVKGNPIQLN